MKIIKLLVLLILFIFISCSSEPYVEHKILYEEPEVTKIRCYTDFSKGLYEALKNQDIADFIISKAKDKIDYDYNVIYASVADEKINGIKFFEYIFKEEVKQIFFQYQQFTNDELIEKFPLLNIYCYNIDKYKKGQEIEVYVIADDRAYLINNEGTYSLDKEELLNNAPKGFALVVGDNERFKVKKLNIKTRRGSVTSTYDEILSNKKYKQSFILKGYQFEYRDLIYINSDDDKVETRGNRTISLGKDHKKMITLKYSRFSSVSVYKNAEG